MKADYEIIKLEFISPLHIGRGWGDLDHSESVLHSDTIKSALFSALIQLAPEWKTMPDDFFKGFRISSCFPWTGDEIFLPKLQLKRKFLFEGISDNKQAKASKNVEYMSLKIFQKYINTTDEISVKASQLSKNGKYIFEHETPEIFIVNQVQQRLTVKDFEESTPFFADRYFFVKNSGLYFLASFSNEKIREAVFKALKLLGNLGIGTDRTIGNGFFNFDENIHVSKIETKVENPDGYAALGLYLPLKGELEKIDLGNSYWGLLQRGGYMAGSEFVKFRHLLKKSIFMFTEGSVFKTPEKPEGKSEDLTPDWNDENMHKVWRCGMPLFIPVKI